jgi:hypothetical protein
MNDPLHALNFDADFITDCQTVFKSPVGARVLSALIKARNPVEHAFCADARHSDHFHGGAQVVAVLASCSGWYDAMKPKAGPPTQDHGTTT